MLRNVIACLNDIIFYFYFSRTMIDTTGSTLSRTLSNTLSSTASSQDSLHKHQKKKGIKSSIGRLFSKKEKAKQKDAMGRELMPAGKKDLSPFNSFSFVSIAVTFVVC